MTLNDFLKRVSEKDKDKMIIYREGEGWSNVNIHVREHEITITCDDNAIFSDDK
ncbi:hypothetical protein SAMN05192533_102288 [Mesobacillus persicus]|uniref:Uncharacterized protein n=1 Tax=Mesobacillus persicus TaxID=930146 RepID=A0A1H7XPZ8_9BACI|nr:hypothetical protein [Mesobacillus persicus]SEM35257.1 hypothetical protein SAMN05192533_102288 [Mesobacillus persicus]